MTAELNVQGEVSEISNGVLPEVVEDDMCGLDKTGNYEDLSKVSSCYSGVSTEVEKKEEDEIIDKCDRKDDADGSYIFVSASDVVAAAAASGHDDDRHHEPADSDLNVGATNEKTCCEENVPTPENNVVELEDLRGEVISDAGEDRANNYAEQLRSDLEPKVDEQTEVESHEDSQVIVPGNTEWKSESLELLDGTENNGGDNSLGLMRPVEVEGSEINITSSVESKQDHLVCEKNLNGENKSDFVKGSQEVNVIDDTDVKIDVALQKELIEDVNEIPLGAIRGSLEEDSERNLTDPCPVADIKLDTVIVNGPLDNEKRDGSTTDCVPDRDSGTVNVSEDATEQYGASESTKRDLVISDVNQNPPQENEALENIVSLATVDATQNASEQNGSAESIERDSGTVDTNQTSTKQTGFSESVKSVPVSIVGENTERDSVTVSANEDATEQYGASESTKRDLGIGDVNQIAPQESGALQNIASLETVDAREHYGSAESIERDSGTVDANQISTKQTGFSESIESVPVYIVGENASNENTKSDSGTVSANEDASEQCGGSESTKRDLGIDDVNQNAPQENGALQNIASLETVDASEQNGSADSIERYSGAVDADQTSAKQNGFSESIESVPVSIVGENASIENSQCFLPMPNDDKAENLNILPAGTVDDARTEIQFGEQDTKISETPDSLPVDVDIEHENGLIVENTKSNCKYATLEGATSTVEDNADTFHTNAESGAECSYTQLDTDAGEDVGSPVDRSVEEESGPRPCSVANVKLVPEVKHLSDLSSRNMLQNHDITFGSIIRNGNAVNSESMAYNLPVENDRVLLTSPDGDHNEASQEAEDIGVLLGNETLTLSPKHSTGDILDGHIADMEVGKRPFYFLIRLPRSDEERLREQIKQAQIQVDENTRGRDAIRAEIQIKKATCKEYGQDIDAAISGERTARGFLKSKRQEMDAVQSVINRLKNAISVEDIDGRIRNMEHMIQHETLPLKEEKQIIREIKQLKQLREELSNNMGRQAEVQQSLDHKDNIEERLKHLQSLRKEIDVLRDNVLKAEAVTKAARKKYDDENDKLNTLLARFKAANDIRQESYAYFQGLRKQLYDKNKYFWKYKDDVKAANEIASKEDKEELQKFCINQVERTMELWNKNDQFRREYVKNNTRSTLRRLRTLDGRSLGPDEEPPIVPCAINERTVKSKSVSSPSTVEQKNEVVSLQADKIEDKPVVKVVVEQRNQTTKSKRPAKPAPSGYGLVRDSGRDEIEDVIEEPKRTKEEEELAQKAEELRKEEEAVKLKEQHRLEEIGKAKEALERKKRNAEKVQQRAALRAQKEAEQKEKEKEKRARKKERMKAASLGTTNGINEGEPARSSEAPTKTPEECDEKPITTIKKPVKPSQFKKLTKAISVPLPIRNRGKKKMQSWMWVLIVALAGVALFLLGNSSFSLRSGLKGFGF